MTKIERQFQGGKLIFHEEYKDTIYERENMKPINIIYHQLKTGKLFIDLKALDGYIFLDNKNNIYDTIRKNIDFNNGLKFTGDKEGFSLFDNFNDMEQEMNKAIEDIRKVEDINEKQKIEDAFCEKLEEKLNEFNFNKILLKNGWCYENYENYYYINDNKVEFYEDNKKIAEGEFIQEIENDNINIIFHGNCERFYYDNYKGEGFYDVLIGRGNIKGDKNQKFYCASKYIFENLIEEIEKKKYVTIYKTRKNRIILEENNMNKNAPIRIIVKDKENENIIYEINAKASKENILIGNGIVKDYRTGELLHVNFNTNNIISSDFFSSINLYKDEEEYNMYNNKNKFIEKINKDIDPTKEVELDKINKKYEMLDIDKIIYDDNKLEELSDVINKKRIFEEKFKYFGIQDQEYSGECWVYSLALLICLANARKYGRKLENFDKIYTSIIKEYSRLGKTDDEKETIMKDILPNFGLSYERFDDENILKNYIKKGIKCLVSFFYNKKEWDNFTNYYNDNSINQEDKVFTLDILNKPNNKHFEEPNERSGHAVILSDIDEDDNYILINSWGKDWGNNGTFKMKKECLKDGIFFAIYYTIDLLTEEEKESWNKLKIKIKNLLNEMKSIRCPICKRSALIEKFEIIDRCKYRCPYEEKCEFTINKYDDKELNEFLIEQLMSYDLDNNIDAHGKFDLGFNYG